MKIVVPCLLSQTCAYCGIGFSDTRKRKYCPGLCAKQAAKRRVKAWWANNRSYSNEKNRRRRAAIRSTKPKRQNKILVGNKNDNDQLRPVQANFCGDGGLDEGVPRLLPDQHETVHHVPEAVQCS